MKKLFSKYTPLQIAMHLYAWSTVARLIFEFATGTLSVNPIQELEQRTGRQAITLLVLSLACSPLNALFGWRELLKRRRALGLYTFMYAVIHVVIFVDLDYGLALSQIAKTVLQKPYIIVGVTSFLLLIPLALTSFDIWKKRLGKNWKRLHQFVYFIAPLVVLHYALIYGIIILIFLIFRIPPVRKAIASLSIRNLFLFNKKDQHPKVDTP
jgi:sulfoxide reductase heme-binding subunit YedZ